MKAYHNLTIKSISPETANAVTMTLDVPDDLKSTFSLSPGQHIKLKTKIDGKPVERFYSVCAYDDSSIQVGIKRVEEGVFSNHACEQLQSGQTIEVQAPQGDFHLPPKEEINSEQRFFFLAAGSGITPILAMVNELLTKHQHTHVVLVYVNAMRKDIMFFKELENLKNTHMDRISIVHVLTREPRDLPMLSQRPDETLAKELIDSFVGTDIDHAYLCGPFQLIELFRNILLEKGLTKKQVHLELFGTPDSQIVRRKVKRDSDNEQLVTVVTQGRSQTVLLEPGQNVLDAALAAGADVPFACKGGVCATCKAKLIEGEAEMAVNYGLEDDQVEKGYVLTCQTFVKSDSALFDFDV